MPESDFHHERRVMAFVEQMFSLGRIDNAVITLGTGDKLNGQLRGTTEGGQNNSIRLLSSGRILSVAMREIVNIEYAVPN